MMALIVSPGTVEPQSGEKTTRGKFEFPDKLKDPSSLLPKKS
jgi:hypothetical protein